MCVLIYVCLLNVHMISKGDKSVEREKEREENEYHDFIFIESINL